MKKLLVLGALLSAAACIEWPDAETIGQRRCAASPDECLVLPDGGASDGGSGDGGAREAGPWRVDWADQLGFQARYLVGEGTRATLVGSGGAGLSLHPLGTAGPDLLSPQVVTSMEPTAAFELDDRVVVAGRDGGIIVWAQGAGGYTELTRQGFRFVTTAVNLYPLPDAGLAVAAYGEQDGGLAVTSFGLSAALSSEGSDYLPCATTSLRPQHIRAAPDAGLGIVVGDGEGTCPPPVDFSLTGNEGFVGRFGVGFLPSGFKFPVQTGTRMVLSRIDAELRLAHQLPGTGQFAVANVPTVGTSLTSLRTILVGTLTLVELVDLPGTSDFLLVGFANGAISTPDGGLQRTTLGEDVFIARLNTNNEVIELEVFADPGDQTAVGAVWLEPRLILGGTCSAPGQGRFCGDAGLAWVTGLRPN